MLIFQFRNPEPRRAEDPTLRQIGPDAWMPSPSQVRTIDTALVAAQGVVETSIIRATHRAETEDRARYGQNYTGNVTRQRIHDYALEEIRRTSSGLTLTLALTGLEQSFRDMRMTSETQPTSVIRDELIAHGGIHMDVSGTYNRSAGSVARVFASARTNLSTYFGPNHSPYIVTEMARYVESDHSVFGTAVRAVMTPEQVASLNRTNHPQRVVPRQINPTTAVVEVPTVVTAPPVRHAPTPIVSDHERHELDNAVRAIPPDLLDRYHITHGQLSSGLADMVADMRRQNRELGPDERLPRGTPMQVAMAIIHSFDRNEPVELRLPSGQSSSVIGAAVFAFSTRLRAPNIDDAHAFSFTFSRAREGYIFGQGWQVEITDRVLTGAAPTSSENWSALMNGMRTADQRGDARFGRALDAMFFGRPTSTHDITRSEYENAAAALGIREMATITEPIRRVADSAHLRSLSYMGLNKEGVAQIFADFYAANEPVYMESRGISADGRIEIMQWAVDFINGGRNAQDTMSFTDPQELAAVRSMLARLGLELRDAGVDAETNSTSYQISRISST